MSIVNVVKAARGSRGNTDQVSVRQRKGQSCRIIAWLSWSGSKTQLLINQGEAYCLCVCVCVCVCVRTDTDCL